MQSNRMNVSSISSTSSAYQTDVQSPWKQRAQDFKALQSGQISAAALDVIRPDARGAAVGFMNMTGWIGAAVAPLFIGAVAQRSGLGLAISLAAAALLLAAVLLLIALKWTLQRDVDKMNAALVLSEAGA